MYVGLQRTKDLKKGQLVMCRCPNWNEEGYQVAKWNGNEFEYATQPNNMFHDHVLFFAVLENGLPINF